MNTMLHASNNGPLQSNRRRLLILATFSAALWLLVSQPAPAGQMGGMGGQGGMGGMGGAGGRMGGGQPSPEEVVSAPREDKPDIAARKSFNAGMKSLNKAKDEAAAAASASNEDKKNAALEKMNDLYGRALDQFTDAVANRGDMYEAWNNVGYIHLRLGAFNESIDDYNHTLALKPDLLEATEHRAEAYVAVDRLEEAQSAYMDLFNHDRKLADQLMVAMQRWVTDHRADANGMRASDIDAFAKWVQERDGIAKQTASLPP
jgi:tetratricopeptide (TPR) repeat protein